MNPGVRGHLRAGNTAGKILLAVFLAAALLLAAGCAISRPANIDWAAPASTGSLPRGDSAIQQVLESYGQALVDKDRNKFASLLDPASGAFEQQQLNLYDKLKDVPFSRYQITLDSTSQSNPAQETAKVRISYTFSGSFTGMPEPARAAFLLVRKKDGWKLSGDATLSALGKARDAELWDFGPVTVMKGAHLLVLYHPGNEATARQLIREGDAAYPRLQQAIPGTSLPLIPVKVFDSKQQIDQAYPGEWQEWTGGAARKLGSTAAQGGEIIIDAALYQEGNSVIPGYNRKMIGHEMTHIALFPFQGSRTPPFLLEGLADFVGGQEASGLIREKLGSGASFSPALDDLYQPSGFQVLLSSAAADLAYEEADTAVLYLEQKYGNQKTLDLLRAFQKNSLQGRDQGKLVDEVFRDELGTSWADFKKGWEDFVLSGGGA